MRRRGLFLLAFVFVGLLCVVFLRVRNERQLRLDHKLIEVLLYTGSPASVEKLLKAGADPNAILLAPEENAWMAPLRAVLGGKPPTQTEPVLFAALFICPDTVPVLLKFGADPNARGLSGMTPLIAASACPENPGLTKVLLDAGADRDALDTDGTALDQVNAVLQTERRSPLGPDGKLPADVQAKCKGLEEIRQLLLHYRRP